MVIRLVLTIVAVVVGGLIVGLILIKRSGATIGVQTTDNIFTEQIANVRVYSWLLGILVLIELSIFVYLLISSEDRSLIA
jgi:hypothetical protein